MKKILLINPMVYDFDAFDVWLQPLGLLYIGAFLEKYGHKVSLIDCMDRWDLDILKKQGRVAPRMIKHGQGPFYCEPALKPFAIRHIKRPFRCFGVPPDLFRNKLRKVEKPDVILVTSAMTYQYSGVFRCIKICKEEYPKVPVLLGGIYATLCYDHAVKNSGADYVVKGEGELKALKLVDKLTGNKRDYSDFPEKLDHYPYPAYHLYPYFEHVNLLTSRGCPYHCSYCASNIMYTCFRQRDPLKVVDEIEYWHIRHKIKKFVFFDDALLLDAKKHIEPILDEIIKRSWLRAQFFTPNSMHAKFITASLARKMRSAGFRHIRISIETINIKRQQEMGDKVRPEHTKKALRHLRDAGFPTDALGVYVLIGLSNQGVREMLETTLYVIRYGGFPIALSYTPIHGTKEFDKNVEQGLIDKNIDPLLCNNSIFPASSPEVNPQVFQQIKNFIYLLRKVTDGGVNFFDSSPASVVFREVIRDWYFKHIKPSITFEELFGRELKELLKNREYVARHLSLIVKKTDMELLSPDLKQVAGRLGKGTEPIYRITEAAKSVKVSSQFLRRLDWEGIVIPHRRPSGQRLYAQDDLLKIKKILRYKQMGIRGVSAWRNLLSRSTT